jgi:YidC/Oxa1 family membrane protein insertase
MDQKNLIVAIAISVLILLTFQMLFEQPRLEKEQAARKAAEQQQTTQVQPGAPGAPGVPGQPGAVPVTGQVQPAAPPTREAVIGRAERIKIDTAKVKGSVSLTGALIDDLTLADYRETVEPGSKSITLLSPSGSSAAYFARFGWLAASADTAVPGPETVWQADRGRLEADAPTTFTWSNGQGLTFSQVITLDRSYMFTVVQKVRNDGARSVSLSPFGLVSRTGTPQTSGFFILHEGFVGIFNDLLKEIDYDKLKDAKGGVIEQKSAGGWIGVTDKYWLTALIPDQKVEVASRYVHTLQDKTDKYQIDYVTPAVAIPPGVTVETTSHFFAGAKEVRLLENYGETLGINRLYDAVDFGWFWFLTRPIFHVLEYFHRLMGNFGLAILLLTVLIKLAFFPLANKSYRAMSRLKNLQPKMVEIRERYKDDRMRQQQEMMALYKKENANPMAGCLPIAIQIPVFFALYKVLFVTIEMRHAPFYGWIKDLSAPDPLGLLTVFGLVPWQVPHMLEVVNIGIWPIIMGGTMWLQQKLNPQPPDPIQAKMFMLLPIIFTFLLGQFPAGLVIYWAWNNTLSIGQQWLIMRGSGAKSGPVAPVAPPASATAAPAGGGGRPGGGGKGKRSSKPVG